MFAFMFALSFDWDYSSVVVQAAGCSSVALLNTKAGDSDIERSDFHAR